MEKGNWNLNSQFWTDNGKSHVHAGWMIPYIVREGNSSVSAIKKK